MSRRVAVTGVGAVTPLGNDVSGFWQGLLEGRSGIDRITRFDTTEFRTKIAGEIRGFDPLLYMDRKQAKRTDFFIQYAVAASRMAIQDAMIDMDAEDAFRVGVIIGTAIGGISHIEQTHSQFLESGPKKISPLFLISIICNMASGQVALNLGAKGFSTCVVTACASGAHAIGDAFKAVQRGDADIMIAGGAEGALTPLVVGGLESMKVTSTRDVDPAHASCPFDSSRD
ncbi:MAG: beta-ketoacyl synthase N-terminal-like domain-containing protein, partial [Thermodesulfobacteriota bacterium]